jgi:hypothetical protein
VRTSRYSGSPIGARLLGAVEHGDRLDRGGQRGDEVRDENGRYSRTLSTPTFSPWATRCSTVSWAVSAPEPIIMITRSASGAPT